MKTLKDGPQKLLILGPKLFFHTTGPAAQTSPELIFHIINMSQDSSVSLSVLYNLEVRKENEGLIYYKKKKCERILFL